MGAQTMRNLLLLLAIVLAFEGGTTGQPVSDGRWEPVFVEDFESGTPGGLVGAPWVQRHPRRQIVTTDQAAASGRQCAMFRYEVAGEGSLDAEAGLFFMEAPIPRPKGDALGTWRISAAMRFHPIAWTAATFRLRGDQSQSIAALVNSSNLFFLGGSQNIPVWNVADPDRWYRFRILVREDVRNFDLEIGEEGGKHRNYFYNIPIAEGALPLRCVGFGYCGALVRYGQGREAFIDDVRVERRRR
jgi:hypothetical protein